MVKVTLREKNKVADVTLWYIRLHYKVAVIKKVCHWFKKKKKDTQINKSEKRNRDLRNKAMTYGQFHHNKGGKNIQSWKDFLFNKCCRRNRTATCKRMKHCSGDLRHCNQTRKETNILQTTRGKIRWSLFVDNRIAIVQFLSLVHSLQLQGLQYMRLSCPSQCPRACSNPCQSNGDAIQPSRPLLSPYPLALNLSHHQGLF